MNAVIFIVTRSFFGSYLLSYVAATEIAEIQALQKPQFQIHFATCMQEKATDKIQSL